jgi:hypothetical protein
MGESWEDVSRFFTEELLKVDRELQQLSDARQTPPDHTQTGVPLQQQPSPHEANLREFQGYLTRLADKVHAQ